MWHEWRRWKMCAPRYYFGRGRLKLQVSCLCLTFYDLRDCFPCALQCALVEIGVAARTWFDVRSCNSTDRVTLVWDGWASAFWVRSDHYGYGRRWGCCWIIGLLFVVTMRLLLNYWSCCLRWQWGYCWIIGRVVCGHNGAVAELLVVLFEVTVGLLLNLLVVLFEVTVGLLLNYWSCCLRWQWGFCWIIGRVVWGDSGPVAELLVVLFEVTVGLLLSYWWIHVGGFGYYWVSCRIIDLLILVWHLDGGVVYLIILYQLKFLASPKRSWIRPDK